MPLTVIDEYDLWKPAEITVSNAGRRASHSQTAWRNCFGTKGVDAATANHYIEFSIVASGANVMFGIGRKLWGDSMRTSQFWTSGNAYLYYSADGNKYIAGASSSHGASFGVGDRIGVLIKNGKLYFRKNGTWQNSADPIAETGFAASGITGTVYPVMNLYSAPTVDMMPSAALQTGSLPAGSLNWDHDGSAQITLVDPSGNPLSSTEFKWAFFASSAPNGINEADATGIATTNGSGVLALDLTGTALDDGETGFVVGSTTTGVAANQSTAFAVPVVIDVQAGA